MPKIVTLGVNPDFKAGDAKEKDALAAAKKVGNFKVDYGTAVENMRNSNGMYAIIPEAATSAPQAPSVDDMDDLAIKTAMASLGIAVAEGMTRADAVEAVKAKLAEPFAS